MRLARMLVLGVVLAFGYSLVTAADEDKDIKAAVLKLAAALEKNDQAAAKKLVDELKKQDLDDVMSTMKPPKGKNGGFDVVKEGIENKVRTLSKKAGDVQSNAADYEKMAHIIAAIMEVAAARPPEKAANKDPKDWERWVNEARESAKALGDAAKAKDAKKVTAAAKKLNGACNDCHGVFRD